jgi:hypothetical protein
VEYSVEPDREYPSDRPCPLGRQVRGVPWIIPARKGKKVLNWSAGQDATKFTIDEESCAVRVRVKGQHGVDVWNTRAGRPDPFLSTIVISARDNTVTYEGTALVEAFQRRSRWLYTLSYGHDEG